MKQLKLVVIGGGAAGAAAAYKLRSFGHDVTLIEKEPRIGGRIKSEQSLGTTVDIGPSFITPRLYPTTFELIQSLNLAGDLNQRETKVTLVKNNWLYSGRSALSNTLFSLRTKGKITKLLLKTILHASKLNLRHLEAAHALDTQTVQEAYKEPTDRELLEYLLQPSINGYFFWLPERTSVAMLLILVRSMLRKGKSYDLKHGLQQIPEALVRECETLLGHEVKSVRKTTTGTYTVTTNKEIITDVSGIVCATTATAVPKIFSNLTVEQKTFFDEITYSSTAVVARSFTRSKPTPSTATVFPRKEQLPLSSVGSSCKIRDDGSIVETFRCFASGESSKELLKQDDDKVAERLAVPSLVSPVGETRKSEATIVQRWPEALPEFKVGHITSLARFAAGEIETEGDKVVFAGDYIGGPYIEGAITSGFLAAERLHEQLQGDN